MQRLLKVLLCVCVSVTSACAFSLAEDETETAENSNGFMLFDLGRTDSVVSDARHMRRYLTEEGPDAPLYRGFGTHFVYVYVGTPKQRVSVIVDTGSHHTAFPCTGCNQCGDHTDLYFNPKESSTIEVPKCGGKNCAFSQSYTEGSMWTAYRVKDRFFIGGETTTMAKGSEKHDVEFTFGCQTKETGLFRTQMENGIMGLSADAKTLPNTLYRANMTTTNAFALCFLPTGGVMSLGGTHPLLKQGPMGYAQMTKKSGYFTVKVLSMFLRKASSTDLTELKMPMTKLNSGKGVIVDSGTTDTYLPSAISSAFQSLFKKLCGTSYTRSTFSISEEELKGLPTVVFHLQKWQPDGKSKEYVQVEMPPTRYLELSNKAGKGGKAMYVFRLYLTERSGGVLGANFMTGQNVEFDQKQLRVGFAPSHCKASSGEVMYPGMSKPVKLKKHRHRKLDDEEGSVRSVDSTEKNHHQHQQLQQQGEEGEGVRRRLAAAPLRASGPCNAQCNGRKEGGVTAAPSSAVRTAAGFMPATVTATATAGPMGLGEREDAKTYVANSKAGAGAATSGKTTGKIPCALACDAQTGEQVRLVPVPVPVSSVSSVSGGGGGEEACPVRPWARCEEDCMQTRSPPTVSVSVSASVRDKDTGRDSDTSRDIGRDRDVSKGQGKGGHTSNSSSSSSKSEFTPACLLQQSASRQCWRELCPFRPALQCALRLQLSLPLFKAKKWNALWKEDVVTAIAQTLKMDPARLDIPEALQRKDKESVVLAIVHIRTSKVKEHGDKGRLVCPTIDGLMTEAGMGMGSGSGAGVSWGALRDGFVKNLHGLNSTICGSWDWVRAENTVLAEDSPGRGTHFASRQELNVKTVILRRQERERERGGSTSTGNKRHRRSPPENTASLLVRWKNLIVRREHFYKAMLYMLLLVLSAVSFMCYFRTRQYEHRKKLESPRSDINGYKYYTPAASSSSSSHH